MAKDAPKLKPRSLGKHQPRPSTKKDLPGSEKARIEPKFITEDPGSGRLRGEAHVKNLKNIKLAIEKSDRKLDQMDRSIPSAKRRRGGETPQQAKDSTAKAKASSAKAALSEKKPVKTKADRSRAALSTPKPKPRTRRF